MVRPELVAEIGFTEWTDDGKLRHPRGTVTMGVCHDAATLAYLANQACITPHPWLSRTDRLDRLVFDLDPPADDFEIVRWATRELGDLLTHVGLLDRRTDFDTARASARSASDLLAARHPDKLTTAPRKDKSRGRLYLDTQRNAYAQNQGRTPTGCPRRRRSLTAASSCVR
ncbi:hypothetical protein SSP24_00210 [Streptomyces spinoverrucosus]|uniref:DNA ligase D polymerase domain-containing protein n=1 Tax=Streptomyces spinoverrucosus TaxID=284043 RepID=A0A4Y3VBK6_9ACTN|nr:hypothetical protein SSP24_00210 [Streptomyces spinoverrucosus]GHB43480.1 hypothetical protein GCM10010397_12380 [Streptomyces spinoverrucosus]